MSRVVTLAAPRQLVYEAHALPPLGPDDVHVRTRLGAISAGTEAAWYLGTDPQLDPAYRSVRFPRAGFPRRLGYEKVADVVRTGARVTHVQPGDRVVAPYGHAEEQVVASGAVIRVPDGISDEVAVCYSLATVALHAVRRSRLRIGDDVLVTGQGFVGVLTTLMARLAGAGRIVVTDPYAQRRALALRFGADEAVDVGPDGAAPAIRARFGPECVDVAFECSSSYAALADGLALVRRNGCVCVVSQLKGTVPAHPMLGVDFHLGELSIVSSDGRGDVQKLARWFFDAVVAGRIPDLQALISHRVAFEELARGYELLEHAPGEVMKVLVTYAAPGVGRESGR